MKRTVGLLFLLGIIFFTSCNNSRSYADMKKDQKKIIGRLIDREDIEVLKRYPADSVFKENQYYLLDNGVYLNVVDSGNGTRAITGSTNVLMRCEGVIFQRPNMVDTMSFDLFTNNNFPIEFVHGRASSTASNSSTSSEAYYFLSEGVDSALLYVGDGAIVKLIVPFEVGSPLQYSSKQTGYVNYYRRVRFTFD